MATKAPRVLHALDDKLKALASRARELFLSKDHHGAALLAAEAREHAMTLDKEVHQLSDGSLALATPGAHPSEVAGQVAEDPSAALLGNQEAPAA